MAAHSSILAWRIPWTEEPGRLQSKGWQRVGHNWVTNTFTFHVLLGPYVFDSFPSLPSFLCFSLEFLKASSCCCCFLFVAVPLSPNYPTPRPPWTRALWQHGWNLFSSLPLLSNSFWHGKPPMLPYLSSVIVVGGHQEDVTISWPSCWTGAIRGSSPLPLTWTVYATHCSHSGSQSHTALREQCVIESIWVYMWLNLIKVSG